MKENAKIMDHYEQFIKQFGEGRLGCDLLKACTSFPTAFFSDTDQITLREIFSKYASDSDSAVFRSVEQEMVRRNSDRSLVSLVSELKAGNKIEGELLVQRIKLAFGSFEEWKDIDELFANIMNQYSVLQRRQIREHCHLMLEKTAEKFEHFHELYWRHSSQVGIITDERIGFVDAMQARLDDIYREEMDEAVDEPEICNIIALQVRLAKMIGVRFDLDGEANPQHELGLKAFEMFLSLPPTVNGWLAMADSVFGIGSHGYKICEQAESFLLKAAETENNQKTLIRIYQQFPNAELEERIKALIQQDCDGLVFAYKSVTQGDPLFLWAQKRLAEIISSS